MENALEKDQRWDDGTSGIEKVDDDDLINVVVEGMGRMMK